MEQGPNLIGLGSKVKEDWLLSWLKDPYSYHEDTKMPNLRITDQEAKDIAAYLLADNNTKFDETTKIVANYSKLKGINLVKPTIHRYLAGHTKSQFRRIDADEFTVATLLPVQRFKKASEKEVWRESRSMI